MKRDEDGLNLGLGDLVGLVVVPPLDTLGEHLERRFQVPFARLEVPHQTKRIYITLRSL